MITRIQVISIGMGTDTFRWRLHLRYLIPSQAKKHLSFMNNDVVDLAHSVASMGIIDDNHCDLYDCCTSCVFYDAYRVRMHGITWSKDDAAKMVEANFNDRLHWNNIDGVGWCRKHLKVIDNDYKCDHWLLHPVASRARDTISTLTLERTREWNRRLGEPVWYKNGDVRGNHMVVNGFHRWQERHQRLSDKLSYFIWVYWGHYAPWIVLQYLTGWDT